MTRTITVAGIQTSYGEDMQANIDKTIAFVREAAGRGAQVILPSELFQGPYFCVTQEEHWFAQAHPWREHPCVTALAPLAGRFDPPRGVDPVAGQAVGNQMDAHAGVPVSRCSRVDAPARSTCAIATSQTITTAAAVMHMSATLKMAKYGTWRKSMT